MIIGFGSHLTALLMLIVTALLSLILFTKASKKQNKWWESMILPMKKLKGKLRRNWN